MRAIFPNQSVQYVTNENVTVEGIILEVFPPYMVHLQWGEKHIALARYSEGKEPNTYHFADGEPEAGEHPRPKPFRPGAKAVPDKPKAKGAPAPQS